jgi:integrase
VGVVLDYAKGKGWRKDEAPLRAVNQLMRGIKQPKGGNFAALPYAELPGLTGRLRSAEQSVGRLALQFLILTAARTGEVRKATWQEIDFEAAEWWVPEDNAKKERAHLVPLVPAAITIIEQLREMFGSKPSALIFPGLKGMMSENTLAKAFRLAGGGSYTVHGLRSTFRDWAAETGQPDAWAEAALSHKIPDKVEAAYRRTVYFNQRRDTLMPAWASFALGPDNLVSLASRRA